jgi:ubiquinone/menaquinone biosynthesis C-methylase UbiE
MKEPFLEPVLRKMRIAKVLPVLNRMNSALLLEGSHSSDKLIRLLDVGCGWEARFLKSVEPYIASGVGIDFKAPNLETAKLKTITLTLDNKLPFEDNSFDVVSLMAVLEHLEKPLDILREIHRVLKKDSGVNGVLIGTVPSKAAKPVLEFLSYKLGIVNEAEIRDHKQYFNKKDLAEIFAQAGFLKMEHKYFQFGMNNFFVAYPLPKH